MVSSIDSVRSGVSITVATICETPSGGASTAKVNEQPQRIWTWEEVVQAKSNRIRAQDNQTVCRGYWTWEQVLRAKRNKNLDSLQEDINIANQINEE